jgi:hypothetical protein
VWPLNLLGAAVESGTAVVMTYRAFLLGSTGEVMRRYDFTSMNDVASLEHARQYVENHDVEVWQLHRRVAVLRHTDKAA